MRYATPLLALALILGVGAWEQSARHEPKALAPRVSVAHRTDVRATNGSVEWAAAAASHARRLLATDLGLIEPEVALDQGALPTKEGTPALRYALRLTKRTLALQEPLEATLTVHDSRGQSRSFRVTSKDIMRVDGGYSEPGGSWSEQASGDGTTLTWVPGELPAPTGRRELVVVIELDGEQHSLSATFAIGAGSPIAFTGHVVERRRTGVLQIDVEFEAKESFSCELSANLFDTAGTPLQHTAWSGTLGPEASHAVLEFSQEIQADTHTLSAPIVVRQFRGTCWNAADLHAPEMPVALIDELYRTPQ
jgi:hypothetical protein